MRSSWESSALARAGLVLISWVVASSCVAPPRSFGQQCLFNDDCASPLVCAANRCRAQCRTDRDCPTGQLCSPSDDPSKRVCALPSERALCGSDRDCPLSSVCAARGCWWTCRADGECSARMAGTCDPQSRLCSTPVTAQQQQDLPHHPPDDGGVDASMPTDATSDGAFDATIDAVSTDGEADASDVRALPDRVEVDGERCVGAIPGACGGRCVDLATDPSHCGACGASCAGQCVAGACVSAVAVSVGVDHTCVLGSDGSVYTMGLAGALGANTSSDRTTLTRVAGITGATAVRCTYHGGCALRAGMAPLCWGENTRFQAASSMTANIGAPTELEIASPASETPRFDRLDVRSFAATYVGACMSNATEVFCWGRQGGWSRRPYTATIPTDANAYATGVGAVRQLAAADDNQSDSNVVCALRADGRVGCWGDGLLGYAPPTAGTPAPPIELFTLLPALDSMADAPTRWTGGPRHVATCGVDRAGAVWCGIIESTVTQRPPIGPMGADLAVGGVTITLPVAGAALGVAVTRDAACAIQSDRTVVCWGRHDAARATLGRRGLTQSTRYAPQPVEVCALDATACANLRGVTQISGGVGHFCARTMDGEIVCWGDNDHGQLGSGDRVLRAHAVRVRW
ncbi:MAG: hypothetical protein JNK05_16425 [Myxococcales bacterium]|nr:hypothetical protein [Myxococcales bacterium]